jgi:hypothetical protein
MNINKPPCKTITAHANSLPRRHCEAREKTYFLVDHFLPKQTPNKKQPHNCEIASSPVALIKKENFSGSSQ